MAVVPTSLLKSAGSPGVTSHTTTGNLVPAPPLTEKPNVPLPPFSLVLVNSTTRKSDMANLLFQIMTTPKRICNSTLTRTLKQSHIVPQ